MVSKSELSSSKLLNLLQNSLLGSLLSVTLLISAYTFPSLNWLTWIAFVPYMLVIKGDVHLTTTIKVHLSTFVLISVYFSYVFLTKNLWRFVPKNYLILFSFISIIIISVVQLLILHLSRYRCLVAAILWTIILLIVNIINKAFINTIIRYIGIKLVPQPLLNIIPIPYRIYLLLFLVLLVNSYIADNIFNHIKFVRKTYLKFLIFYF